jgi:alkanesulfonate monooxygenase SsuD/methylene tetrahydromethanopterin reductase-like flavin-dependent oxidoreductase (luciferase family)
VLAEPVTPEYLNIVKGQLGLENPTIVAFALAAVDNDPAVARERARPALAPLGDPDWAPHIAPLAFAEDFRELRASLTADEFAQSMPDEWVDQLAVVGTPDTARERIATLHAAGATCVVLIPLGDPFEALDQFAPIL